MPVDSAKIIPTVTSSTKTLDVKRKNSGLDIELNLSFGTVEFNNIYFNNVYTTAYRKADGWQIGLDNIKAKGTISLFDDKRPPKVHFDRLNWPDTKITRQVELDRDDNTSVNQWTEIDLSTIPSLDFSVDHLTVSGHILGQWRFKLRPDNNGKRIELLDIQGKLEKLTFTGSNDNSGGYFRWDQDTNNSHRNQSKRC